MGPCSEVIICIVIIVATQPTHMALKKIKSNCFANLIKDVIIKPSFVYFRVTLYFGLSLMNRLVLLSHMRISPLLASITR